MTKNNGNNCANKNVFLVIYCFLMVDSFEFSIFLNSLMGYSHCCLLSSPSSSPCGIQSLPWASACSSWVVTPRSPRCRRRTGRPLMARARRAARVEPSRSSLRVAQKTQRVRQVCWSDVITLSLLFQTTNLELSSRSVWVELADCCSSSYPLE